MDGSKGVCELNDKGVGWPIEGKEPQYDEKSVYTLFYDVKVRK